MKTPLLSLALSLGLTLSGQPLDSSSFDFWLGKWQLTWTDAQGNEKSGYNHIHKILGGKVIQENFSDSARGFYGKSWSTWNPKSQSWRQVWTDNQSSFLEFTGQRYGDTLAFVMEPAPIKGKSIVRRMIFYDIKDDSFTWDWQSAPEGSQQWKLLWRIQYQRKQ